MLAPADDSKKFYSAQMADLQLWPKSFTINIIFFLQPKNAETSCAVGDLRKNFKAKDFAGPQKKQKLFAKNSRAGLIQTGTKPETIDRCAKN